MKKNILIVLVAIFFSACSSDIINSAKKTELIFKHKKHKIAGTLITPKVDMPSPVVLLVYGDGPTNRSTDGGASHIINAFLKKGIACFVWDKQGVGDSEGNWLNQDMNARADEAISAMEFLYKRADIDKNRIGFMGISQGGWVIPKIATKTDKVAFYIIQGGAINWLRQGAYFTKQRLKKEGITDAKMVQDVLDYGDKIDQVILEKQPYEKYVAQRKKLLKPKGVYATDMSKDRYEFVVKNIRADSSKDLENITAPLLSIWGEDDLNVDANYNYKTYDEILKKSQHGDYKLVMFKNATHALLNSNKYNYQRVDEWRIDTYINYFIDDGEDVYVDGYLNLLGEWVREKIDD